MFLDEATETAGRDPPWTTRADPETTKATIGEFGIKADYSTLQGQIAPSWQPRPFENTGQAWPRKSGNIDFISSSCQGRRLRCRRGSADRPTLSRCICKLRCSCSSSGLHVMGASATGWQIIRYHTASDAHYRNHLDASWPALAMEVSKGHLTSFTSDEQQASSVMIDDRLRRPKV